MKQKLFIFLLGVVLLSCVGVGIYFKTKPQPVHLHAGFKIYIDNQEVNFSKPELMHLAPCGDEKHTMERVEERVHLHDLVGDVAHIHDAGVTWDNLWESVRFTTSHDSDEMQFYLNGEKVVDPTHTTIQPYDRLLILIGKNENLKEKLDAVPTHTEIETVETKTEGC